MFIYQLVSGEQVKSQKYQELGDLFSTKKMEADFKTVGGTVTTKILKFNIKLSAEYTKSNTPSFDGLGGVEDGEIDSFVEKANIPLFDRAKMSSGEQYNKNKAFFKGIAGGSKNTYIVSGIDSMLHMEAALELNQNVTVSIFMYKQNVKDVESLEVTSAQKEKLIDVYSSKLGYLKTTEVEALVTSGKIDTDTAKNIPTAEYLTEKTAETFNVVNYFGTEWKHSISYGINILYKF